MQTTIKFPKGTIKTDSHKLLDLKKIEISLDDIPHPFDSGLYHFDQEGFRYEFLYYPSSEKRLFVLLNGDFNRKRYSLPVFQRWSWADAFPGHCLFIADPMLYLHDQLGLAWYIGNSKAEPLTIIVDIIKAVASKLNIRMQDVIFYGSSGGAFAALRLSSLLPKATTVAINPQIDVTQYKYFDFFLKQCFDDLDRDEAIKKYGDRFSILPHYKRLRKNKILYVQNTLDKHHFEVHYKLFANTFKLNESNNYKRKNIETYFFEHPDGHKAAETKERFPEIIKKAIALSEKKPPLFF